MHFLQTTENPETTLLVSRVVLFVMLPFLVAFSFVVFVVYRRNREGVLRRRQLELELQAIRARMNPHFIFNCLNSIHYCIQQNESERAGHYLLRFSYLTRRILENSTKRLISLQEDVDMLNAYLELEQLRSGNRFMYSVDIDQKIDPGNVAVPMLLLQPIVENAVWHGFESRNAGGEIKVEVECLNDQIIMKVKDNGQLNDRKEQVQLPGKELSLGKNLIENQLTAIAKLEGKHTSITSESVLDEHGKHVGMITRVILPNISIY